MEIDDPHSSNGSTIRARDTGLNLYPVSINQHGSGLPYAPIDWPNPGDVWGWKSGRRIASNGYFLDRYLYPPPALDTGRRKKSFDSKLSIEQYIQSAFPGTDVNGFFASFSWKIPSKHVPELRDNGVVLSQGRTAVHSGSIFQSETACKAGNRMCISLQESQSFSLQKIYCEMCCSEPDFCRDCCCILCSKTVSSAFGGYNCIRCEATIGEVVCGHTAHADCALRCYIAGTVEGSINLDAEYFCRRCDSKVDLIPHVVKIFQTCKSVDSRVNIEKILNIGICLLRGSRKLSALQLLHHIEVAKKKLKNGDKLEDVWKEEETPIVDKGGSTCRGVGAADSANCKESQGYRIGSPRKTSSSFDYRLEPLLLEEEVSQILQNLKESQEYEFQLAKEMLSRQKDYIVDLYKQIEQEKAELMRNASSTDDSLDAILKTLEQTKREYLKLKEMEQVAKGFGRTSDRIIKEHFGLDADH